MAYLNYKLLYEKGFSDQDYHLLQKIFQKETLLLSKTDTALLTGFKKQGLIQYLKGKEDQLEGLRISKKGQKFLEQLETMQYSDKINKLLDSIISLYENRNKHVGIKLEVQNRLIWFISQTGFSNKVIYSVIEEYLTDNSEYTMSLENLIWRPSSKAFSVHMNLKNSKLYDLICYKFNLNANFFIEGKGTKKLNWMRALADLEISKTVDKSLLFTGDYKTDLEHINKVKEEYLTLIQK